MKDRIVSLVVVVNSGEQKMALLQRRDRVNKETGQLETYPGAYQVTVAGRAGPGEPPKVAILRELKEELGENIAKRLEPRIIELGRTKSGSRTRIVFKAETDAEFLKVKEIRLHLISGKLRALRPDAVSEIKTLKLKDRKNGISKSGDIAMFPDEKQALQQFLLAKT